MNATTTRKTTTTGRKPTGRKAAEIAQADEATTKAAKAAASEPELWKVLYFLRVGDSKTEVHTANCATGRKRAVNKRFSQYAGSEAITTAEVPDEVEFTRFFWADQIAEADDREQCDTNAAHLMGRYGVECDFEHSCLTNFPLGYDPKPVKPVAAKRAAKQALATLLVNCIATAINSMAFDAPAFKEILAGMSEDEVKRCTAQWIHHLPVNRDEWPSVLPKPDRSDWR